MTSRHRLFVPAAFLFIGACAGSAAGDRENAAATGTGEQGSIAMAPMPHSSAGTAGTGTPPVTAAAPARADVAHTAVVYKDANCGCCTKWVDHIRDAGFTAVSNDVTDLDAIKARYGVPRSLGSCHTAEIGGYIVEGHVPADLIRKMLDEKPDIAGIAVPGMPVGSPGMEYTYTEPYDVIAFTKSGATSVYAKR
ncbi:MAG TPA: DUF411 domain-containing protein [Gemmatimonadaceae bacterium]|nr:DUF411 domain-containing protein [Gemmatimonadaceae bacterium]